MSEEAKYSELLKELGSILHEKNTKIFFLEYQVSELEKKISAAELQKKEAASE